MSQENVELSHRAYDAVNRRDLGALLRLMDADVKAVPILAEMEGEPALVTGAVAATLGGALLVGSKALPKRKQLKIRLPRRRSRLSQATQAARAARIQILDTADRVGVVGNQLCDINERLQAITSSARDRDAPSRPR